MDDKYFEVENNTLWFYNYTDRILVDEEKYEDAQKGNQEELSYLDADYTLDEIIKKENKKTKTVIGVTELRRNQDYVTYYTNWTRLVLIGIAPTVLLVYFNYKVNMHRQSTFSTSIFYRYIYTYAESDYIHFI